MTDSSPFAISARSRSAGSGATPRSGEPERVPAASDTPPDLPGCESFRMTAREIVRNEERLEFWDARTETAWKVREVYIQHEQPTHRLAWLASRLSSVRGSPVECFGSVSLVRREAGGRRRWVMQADQILYLNWRRSRPAGPIVHMGEDPLPDVVLEVDHTTDVRRWKLGVYQECGFPEIWVSVPWEGSLRSPGLTIHVRGEDGYRESPESLAFPGWRVEEIHRALTEDPISGAAWRALERVGRAMGAREGTRPEDDPLTRSLSAKARAEGRAKGHAEGRSEGWAEGHTEGRSEGWAEGHAEAWAEAVLATLQARGIHTGADFAADLEPFAGLELKTLIAAALACTDEADFRRRIDKASA